MPVLADGLPACRFMGGQAGRSVFPHRRDACSPIKEPKPDRIGLAARSPLIAKAQRASSTDN